MSIETIPDNFELVYDYRDKNKSLILFVIGLSFTLYLFYDLNNDRIIGIELSFNVFAIFGLIIVILLILLSYFTSIILYLSRLFLYYNKKENEVIIQKNFLNISEKIKLTSKSKIILERRRISDEAYRFDFYVKDENGKIDIFGMNFLEIEKINDFIKEKLNIEIERRIRE